MKKKWLSGTAADGNMWGAAVSQSTLVHEDPSASMPFQTSTDVHLPLLLARYGARTRPSGFPWMRVRPTRVYMPCQRPQWQLDVEYVVTARHGTGRDGPRVRGSGYRRGWKRNSCADSGRWD